MISYQDGPMVQERRRYSRIAFYAPATLTFHDETIAAVVLDLSLKGALVRLPANAVGDRTFCKLCVQLKLNDAPDEIVMEARVVHAEGPLARLLCLSIDLDSITHLRRLVELNLGDPTLLDREPLALIGDD
jgi:hypothetical protein